MTLGEFIESYRKRVGISQRQFASTCDISNGYISMLEKNVNPKTGQPLVPSMIVLKKVARGMGISLSQLLESVEDITVNLDDTTLFSQFDNLSRIETQRIPLIGEIACGQPILATEELEAYVEAGTNIHADFCLRAKGDSMINARIYDGDIVFVRKQPVVENGEIAAVIINDEATLKRVYYSQSERVLQLVAENPKYAPLVYSGEDLADIRILGKAIAFQSDVR